MPNRPAQCPAPRPLGGVCRRLVEDGHTLCDVHERCTPRRRCQALAQGKAPCRAWPMKRRPACPDHAPEAMEARRARARVAAARNLLKAAPWWAPPLVLEALVMAGRLRARDLERLLRYALTVQDARPAPDRASHAVTAPHSR